MEAKTMIIRAWLTILLMGICFSSVWLGLQNKIPAYAYAPFTYVFHMCTPWILLLVAAKSWYRIFLWDRMLKARQLPPILSRGLSTQRYRRANTFWFRIMLQVLFLFAFSGVLNQFSVANIQWWIASIVACFYLLKITLKMGR
jgi:hypothetical protein